MKFLLMIALAISVSCSKSPNSNNIIIKNDTNPESTVIDFGEVAISVPLSGIIPASALDFASLAYKQSGTQDLKITYSPSSGSLVMAAADFDTSLIAPFTIQSNGCITTLLPRKSCIIKLQLNNSQSLPSDQNLTSLIKIKGSDISLTGILKQDLTDYSAPATVISVSPLSLNFGSFKNGESKELSIAVKNNGSAGSAISLSAISNPNVSISFNSCPVSPLLLGARVSCVVRLKYLGAAAEVKNNENLMKIANYQVTHSATVTSPSQEEPEVLTILPQFSSSTVAMNQPDNQARTISFTNSGTVALVAPVSAVSSDNGIQIVSVSCAGGLARSKICDISYNIISSQLPAGASTQTIKLQSGTLASNLFSLNMEVVPNEVPCSVANAQANGVNITNSTSAVQGMKVGENISQCILASNACNQYYSLSGDSKSCNAQTLSCSSTDAQANGWTIANAATYSGNRIGSDASNCNVSSCNLNYEINGKDCTAIACTQANSGIENVLTVSGTKVSGCLVSTCIAEYEQVGNGCSAVSCSLANSQGNGITSILNVASVSGSIQNDSCLVVSCDQYFKNAVDNRSCSPKICTELNTGELTSLGYNLTGATISGTYNSCTVSCTSPLQQLASDGKSCEDKTPTGTISFAQDYTKILTPNVLNITSSNAQSIQFYSDAGCITTVDAAIALPLSSTNLALSSGDGTKTAYAKFLNGTKSSACISDTIILDQTLPAIAVTLPTSGENIAGNSLVVSGTCSEVNNPTISVGVTVNSITQNVPCSSGTFSSSFDMTSFSAATYPITLSATDLAGNIGTSTLSFNRIICSSFQTLSGTSCTDNAVTGTLFTINTLIPQPVYTNQSSVNLDFTGISGAQTMSIAQTVCASNNAADEPFVTTKVFSLTTLNTSGSISVKFKNGTQSICIVRTFVHDNVAPQNISDLVFTSGEPSAVNGVISAATWSSSFDGVSGISRYEYAIGSSVSNTIKDWTSTSLSTSYTGGTEAALVDGQSYQLKVRALDRSGNYSAVATIDFATVYRKTSIGKVAVGYNFNCAIKNYGLVCWGINDKGQLGVNYNTTTGSSTPVQTSLTSGVTDISADGKTACAIKDAKVYCWGDNSLGQLGLGFEGSVRDTPTEVTALGTGISSVAVGGRHVCVIKLGKVYCWGENQYGALGQGTAPASTSPDSIYTASPVPVCTAATCNVATTANHLSNVTKISVGYAHSCAISDNKAFCWGYNNKGQVGTGTTTNTGLATVLFASATNVYDIAAGLAHTCVVRMGQAGAPAAYSLRFGCWGGQFNGALGDGIITDTIKHIGSIANVTTTGSITMIKAGIYNTCISSTVGVTSPTTANLKCWGLNNRGQVGNSTLVAATYSTEASVGSRYSDNTTTFASVYDVDMNSHNEFGIATTNSHTCVSDAGKISCWGYNGNGFTHLSSIIGDPAREPFEGTNSVITAPFTLPSLVGNTYQSLALGGSSACVVHNGALKCWGANNVGQLGNGTTVASTTPVTPTGFDKSVTQVITSDSTMCAIRAGALYCWGVNSQGQIGNNTQTSPVSTPYLVITSDVIAVASSPNSTTASVAGTAYGWGINASFFAGDPAYSGLGTNVYPASGTSRSLVPSIVCGVGGTTCATTPLLNVTKLSKHNDAGAAITAGKAVYWGRGATLWNRVAANVLNSSSVQETGMIDIFTRIYSSYDDYGCIMRVNGQAYCWGSIGDNGGFSGASFLDKYVTPVGGAATPLTGLNSFAPNQSAFSATCAKKSDRLYCWGTNPSSSGIYADNNNPPGDSRLPTAITTLSSNVGVASIARYMGCAEHNGQIKCWGNLGREASTPDVFGPSGSTSSATPKIFNINYVP